MNPPRVNMRSQTWTPSHLPPHNIPLGHPCAPAPTMLYPALDIDWRFDSYMIVYMFQCHSPKSSHLPIVFEFHSCSHQLQWFWSPPNKKSVAVSIVSLSICHEVIGLDAMILGFWMLSFKPAFSLSSFTFFLLKPANSPLPERYPVLDCPRVAWSREKVISGEPGSNSCIHGWLFQETLRTMTSMKWDQSRLQE